jgi:hypothetical protein
MPLRIDRLQLATNDRKAAAEGWVALLDAQHVRDDRVNCLAANRSVYQVGRSEVEFLEPDGAGAISRSLQIVGRPHLFAAGVAGADLDESTTRFVKLGIDHVRDGDQIYVTYKQAAKNDLRFVLSKAVEREPVGLLDRLYEATILADAFQPMANAVTRLFDADEGNYCPIASAKFKYDGVLTLFNDGELDRFEVITPNSDEATMGRFHLRRGRAFYMAFAETPHMLEIERRAKEAGAGITVERPEGRAETEMADSMFLHPPALGGMMLGLSRPTQAWSWSGKPDQVVKI